MPLPRRPPLFDALSPEKRVSRKVGRIGARKSSNRMIQRRSNVQQQIKIIKDDKFDYLLKGNRRKTTWSNNYLYHNYGEDNEISKFEDNG